MTNPDWHRLGPVEVLKQRTLQTVTVEGRPIALSFEEGRFGAILGRCLHVGGRLGEGTLRNGYIVCPWHGWTYQRETGEGEPGSTDAVPRYLLKEEGGDLYIDLASATHPRRASHPHHPLARRPERAEGPLRLAGISATVMDRQAPRYSTSEDLLGVALEAAAAEGAETKLIQLDGLKFRACEGYYSKSAHACTWPCSITQMDDKDELTPVYEALVHWADVVLIATPIRWGNASSLYFKMIERMNCIQNQITIRNRVLIRNKVAGFIVTGGQDNVQAVAGEMMMFFGELGFSFPQFPFVGHSRGWSAEDMENNMNAVKADQELREGTRALARRCLERARELLAVGEGAARTERGGRKANAGFGKSPGPD
jgi:multimeric flavodoxin WrbA/nitrite reductase/ring-hydroxylating ferredoxin subunit